MDPAMQLDEYFDSITERDWQTVTDPEEAVRIAVIGAGWWTRNFVLPAIAETDLCELAVVVDRDAENRTAAAADWDAVTLGSDEFTDGREANAYDAVYIATPNNTHLTYTRTAALLGKHVMCEKPMEVNAKRAREMVEVCDREGVTLMVGYRMQLAPVVRRTRELLDAGFIGEVRTAHSHVSDKLLEVNDDPDQWKLQPEIAGACAAIQVGVYPLNTTRFVLGEDPVATQATSDWTREEFEGLDENVYFQLEFPDHVTALCSASHNTYNASHLKITGLEGEITIDPAFMPWEPRKLTIERHGTRSSVTFDQVNQVVEEFDHFADCILSNKAPEPDGDSGLRDIEIIESILEAAETGRKVSV